MLIALHQAIPLSDSELKVFGRRFEFPVTFDLFKNRPNYEAMR